MRFKYLIKNDQILREFLLEQEISKKALTDLKYHGGKILVNNKEENVRYLLKENDVVEIIFPHEASDSIQAQEYPIDLVYEDEYVLIVNKESKMICIPDRFHQENTLANYLKYYYETNCIESAIHFVNRLDEDTSGLLVIAKHRHIHHLFSKDLKNRMIRKYIAIVHGVIEDETLEIVKPIKKIDQEMKRIIHPDGDYAKTKVKVLNRFNEYTLIECELETGRTHQIRIHLSSIGHPLVGDLLYGGMNHLDRVALHSSYCKFKHPIYDREIEYTQPIPFDLEQFLNKEN